MFYLKAFFYVTIMTMFQGESQVHVKRSVILVVLAIVPVCLFVGLFDYYVKGGSLLPYMSLTSLLLPLYLLFFELPHIISSYIGFFDKEYIWFYAQHIFLWIPLLLGGFALLLFWNLTVAILLYLVVTMYHVMKQQAGIVLMFGVLKSRLYHFWTWTAISIITAQYLTQVAPHLLDQAFVNMVQQFTVASLILFGVISVMLAYQAPNASARFYVMMTWFMLVAACTLLSVGYLFLAFFMIRFIHDITAFLFYISHEINRNQTVVRNILYKLIPFVPKVLYIVVPAVGVVTGLILRGLITNTEALFIVGMYLGFIHYYLESIMWKRNSLHRQYVKVL